jgi:hypothetical protein
MESVVSRRRTWVDDDRADGPEHQLRLRCQGNRILSVGLQDMYLYITHIRARPRIINSSAGLLIDVIAESGPLGPYSCPNHNDGHTIDGGRVRDAIYRLSLPGKKRAQGKVPSLDIRTVKIRSIA